VTSAVDPWDPDRVAHLNCLLVAAAAQIEPVDGRDGHLHRQVDRIVGPGDALRRLRLLSQFLEPRSKLLRVAKDVEATSFHVLRG
jgi:hypothetical protein